MTLRTLDFYLSGGSSNANPNASLGGGKSTVKLYGQSIIYSGAAMAGVTLLDAAGVSTGTLHFTKATNKLGFQKAGGTVPTGTESDTVSTDGTYTLTCPEGDQSVTVTVVFASLPAADSTAAITATAINQNLFDDVTAAEAEAGAVEYRHFYIQNNSSGLVLATLYIQQQYTGLDYLELGVLSLDSGVMDELLPNAQTPPTDVEFFPVATQAEGLSLTIQGLSFIGVYVRRTVTALSDVSTPSDTAILALVVSI